VTVAVSLADKLDTIVGFFQVDERPTGSKDPFALRRAALGVLSLILENRLRVAMFDLITEAAHPGGADTGKEVAGFLLERLNVQQREAGVRHDLIDAVAALRQSSDNWLIIRRVNALQDFVGTEDGTNLLTAYKRAANILKKEKWEGEKRDSRLRGNDELEAQEAALVAALDKAEPKASTAVEKEDFKTAMTALASLRAPIDAFFDHVTVNDPDQAKRARRLNLLMRFRDAVNRVADFSKIEG